MVFGTACRPTGSGAKAYARFGATRRPADNGSLFERLNSQTFSELVSLLSSVLFHPPLTLGKPRVRSLTVAFGQRSSKVQKRSLSGRKTKLPVDDRKKC